MEAAKQFVEKLPANDKRIALYEVCPQRVLCCGGLIMFIVQGGYHELQNEPDGVKEKFTDECVEWAEAHFSAAGDAAQAKL